MLAPVVLLIDHLISHEVLGLLICPLKELLVKLLLDLVGYSSLLLLGVHDSILGKGLLSLERIALVVVGLLWLLQVESSLSLWLLLLGLEKCLLLVVCLVKGPVRILSQLHLLLEE
jgi:hypothetical protein